MTLSALQRLDLNDELDGLLELAKTAKGLDLLDISDQVDSVLVKLGYSDAGKAADTPPPADPEKPAEVPDEDQPAPEIVTKFLAGDFSKQSDGDFISTLNELDAFVDVFLTLDDVKAGAVTWMNQRATQAA
ncbi:ddrA [Pantoea sp. CCBC3-3-1]|uniref:ddrA n=1 Tax=Pantoea sp. CCBC3-3-1 TaxID=2490851 RepID=UPI0011BE4098|nr:ddrA [Pantoea sp. CCBC3-3-1]